MTPQLMLRSMLSLLLMENMLTNIQLMVIAIYIGERGDTAVFEIEKIEEDSKV
jgi:hypothetical protein